MKKRLILILLVFVFIVSGCASSGVPTNETQLEDYICKDNPLGEGCYVSSGDLNHISPIKTEYTIEETFDTERVGQTPRNWLLYMNEEYDLGGVQTIIAEEESGNRYVQMYSDGKRSPTFPQNAPLPTFIFTSKFNLDVDRAGVAYASVMIPSDKDANTVFVGVATGAVSTIAVIINTNLSVNIKVGGPFFYYSGSGDGGDTHTTNITIQKNLWYDFRFEWDASLNEVKAFLIQDDVETELYSGPFHVSNRVNALANGDILVPNVFRVTMPRYSDGWAYLDNVIVERKGE
ncbi:MAG: hypothetical protein NUK62_00760 [Tenericutes bacterium]|nr:hypothetical protein [Mycoplasmatota bacterium]